MYNIFDNLGNHCEADDVDAALTAAGQLFEDSEDVRTVAVSKKTTAEDLEADFDRITKEVGEKWALT